MNVWEKIACHVPREDAHEEREFKTQLEKAARFTSAQEIDLNLTDDGQGWEVKVYAIRYSTDDPVREIILRIPKNTAWPVELVSTENILIRRHDE